MLHRTEVQFCMWLRKIEWTESGFWLLTSSIRASVRYPDDIGHLCFHVCRVFSGWLLSNVVLEKYAHIRWATLNIYARYTDRYIAWPLIDATITNKVQLGPTVANVFANKFVIVSLQEPGVPGFSYWPETESSHSIFVHNAKKYAKLPTTVCPDSSKQGSVKTLCLLNRSPNM